MPAQLVALDDSPSILLDKPILLIGRHPECDVQIESRKISRRHCCIAQVSDYLIVRDLGSTNGVRINGVRVFEGRLRPGDELTIGNHRFKIHWDSAVMEPFVAGPIGGPRETMRPGVPGDPGDDALEACDEPVPLGDRNVRRVPPGRPPEPKQILPEQIDLAPSGDAFRDSGSRLG